MSPLIWVLLITFVIILAIAFIGPLVFRVDLDATDLTHRLLRPSLLSGGGGHLLGTDALGRDFLLRVMYGTRTSLLVAFGGMVIAVVAGTVLGMIAGMYRGWVDSVIAFLIDVRLAVPSIVIALVAAAVFGSSALVLILIIGFTGWSSFARIIRGELMRLRESGFMEASRSIGSSPVRVMVEHVVINISSLVIVNGTLMLSSFILMESALSYLGLGIQPPNVSLGVLVAEGRDQMINNWWLAIVPSIVIVAIVLQVSLLGDWLRDQLDPKLKRSA